MQKIYFLMLAIVSTHALANFNGDWTGPAQLKTEFGKYDCDSEIEVDHQNKKTFSYLAKTRCGFEIFSSWSDLRVVGDKLFDARKEVGTISDSLVTLYPGTRRETTFTLVGGKLQYKERGSDFFGEWTITGLLTKN